MKITVTDIKPKRESLAITFEGEAIRRGSVVVSRLQRAIYLHFNKVTLRMEALEGVATITLLHPRRKNTTIAALQADVDKIVDLKPRVTNFRKVVIEAGKPEKVKGIKSSADVERFWRDHPNGVVLATRDVVLNMPALTSDGEVIGRVLPGMHCRTWVSERNLDINVVHIGIYQPDQGLNLPLTDPWKLMWSLERAIRTAVIHGM